VLSKGHAAPILYSALTWIGLLPREELLKLRRPGSILEGHPTPRIPFVDVATGSLGQGLSVAAGMAYSAKYLDKASSRFWCIIGDGENMEGSVWEAAAFASHYNLNNLIAFVDVNRLGQSQETSLAHKVAVYSGRWKAFGWKDIQVDGHDLNELIAAIKSAKAEKAKPVVILAKTLKGKYFPEIEDQMDYHGTAIPQAIADHLKGLIKDKYPEPEAMREYKRLTLKDITCKVTPAFAEMDIISTRKAYGDALVALHESDNRVVSLDGDVKNSTFAITLMKKYPEAFIECFIAEQNVVGVATGVACRNKIPFASTFAAFFTRAADQIRMLGISQRNVKLVGSHAGCSIGEDGPSQMALEDLAFFRSIPNAHVFYPSDGVSCLRACELAAQHVGIDYIRTTRKDTPILYKNDHPFQLGKCNTLLSSASDQIAVVTGGVTLHEALAAAKELAAEGVHVRVVDLFTLKPFDKQGVLAAANQAQNRVLTIEDHYREGGIFELVASHLVNEHVSVHGIYVERIPGSCKPEEQLKEHGLDKASIIGKIKSLL
jgi:transketolase